MESSGNLANDPLWREMLETGFLGDFPVSYRDVVDSTNVIAMDMARSGAPTGTVVVAGSQTSGKGRLGRKWLSPPGSGLYFSIILRPRLALDDLSRITLAAGVAVCQALEATTGLSPRLKWPNDLLLNGKKFCGILTETAGISSPDSIPVIVGIGMNVLNAKSSMPADLQGKVTSLFEEGETVYGKGVLLEECVARVLGQVDVLEKGDFNAIIREFDRRDAIKGKHCYWLTPAGAVVSGVSLGVDERGVLHIRDNQGRVSEVISGDINQKKP
ncbi:MAG: biotin--[acetyl-CoA-carboxylase] ligase [Proteobacteria bacterium]|nr:biotin--[acetyl-CoA-carboxylase] ligase [Pseudomonadota bacterium]MBU1708932.1 biotin--[acetyl-CoA-carboxylase] ligase [Pseudomonadota bacterium]